MDCFVAYAPRNDVERASLSLNQMQSRVHADELTGHLA